MAQEAKSKGVHVILGPTVNMQRSPLGGRGFEAYSEDPMLSGLSAGSLIKGMQDHGIQATIKHFVGNDQEDDRRGVNAIIPERALREIYLLPFQLAVRDGNPGCLMTAYNKVNGVHVSQDPKILKDILRDEWNWNGMAMSDWFGTYSTVDSAQVLDLEMPGPTIWRGELLKTAVLTREIKESHIDEAAKRVLHLVRKAIIESGVPENAHEGERNTPETAELLRTLAADSVVLLKNENNVLPLSKDKTVAVIGPNSKIATYCGGGSASLRPYYAVTPYDGIAAKTKNKPLYTIGVDTYLTSPLVGEVLSTEDGKTGFTFKCYDAHQSDPNRKLVDTIHLTNSDMFLPDYEPEIGEKDVFYVDILGYFTPEEDGDYQFGVMVNGTAKLYIDDKLFIDNETVQRQGSGYMGSATIEEVGLISMKKGQRYKLTCYFGSAKTSKLPPSSTVIFGGGMRLGYRKVLGIEEEIANAVKVASQVDQVVLCLGLNSDYESEGFDRTHMDLPPHVDRLVEQVTKANKHTVVVMQSGTPVTMPWVDKVPGLLQAWYGGNETGNGIADVLFGDVNANGKLPLSFPIRVEDNPAFFNYKSENGVTVYGENVYIGYRYYETVKRDVLFPFGYGLSYTTFKLSNAKVSVVGDSFKEKQITVTVDVTNTGKASGKETVQVYISQRNSAIRRPAKELKGYTKVELDAGKTKTATVTIPMKYATSYWNDSTEKWISEADEYDVLVGNSSSSIHCTGGFKTIKTEHWLGL